MAVLHDYEQMSSNYRDIYYKVRFESGKEMHRVISKIVNELEIKPNKTSVQLNELSLYKALLPFKYNDEDIHPNYSKFFIYFSKTKRTTTVEIRKRINQILRNVDFTHAHSQNFVTEMKEIIYLLGTEVMEEIEELAHAEEIRIKDYQEGSSKREKVGNYINSKLAEIAPKVIEEIKGKNNFFSNLQFSKNRIGFFITPDMGKDREIVTEYLKRGDKSEQLKIENFDDETENFFITFSDPEDLGFMRGILSNRYMKEPLEGIKLLGIPLQLIIGCCQYKGMKLNEPEWHELNFNTYYESIKRSIFAFNNRVQIKTYSEDSTRYVIKELLAMTKFNSELELSCYLHYNFLLPIQNYVNKREDYFEKNEICMKPEEFKEKRDRIYQDLLLHGLANIKWKNEVELYKTVVKSYPDAIYQYRVSWLEKQSLDIFIPSLKLGIEYQGIQHYEPIEFFGGVEAFYYRQRLDDLKKAKCKENGVKLIDWDYRDVVSNTNLNRKIKTIDA